MVDYRLAGQVFHISCPVMELAPYRIPGTEHGTADEAAPFLSHPMWKNSKAIDTNLTLISRTTGWVAGAARGVEVYDTTSGILVKVERRGEYFISLDGRTIGKANSTQKINHLDGEILCGPILVLALAVSGVWCLHASAVLYQGKAITFLGESGQGKSTLAADLAINGEPAWHLLADDILPVTMEPHGITAWSHFPQLKMPVELQPGTRYPEHLPLKDICVLVQAESTSMPELQRLEPGEAAKVLVSHTAGTRMFPPELLASHLSACTQAVRQTAIFQLTYPHRKDVLPKVREILEKSC